jgi:hypothetical protein
LTIENGILLVSGVAVMTISLLEDSTSKFVVDISDVIVKVVNCVKNVIVLTIENRSMQVSGVSVMISALLEDSVSEIYC